MKKLLVSFYRLLKNLLQQIKRATGQSRYSDLGQVLDNKQLAAVNKVYADVLRQEKASVASKGIESARAAQLNQAQEVPGFVSAKVTLVKNILRDLARGSQKDFDNRMTELLLDPQQFASFLEGLPKQNQEIVFNAMKSKMSPPIQQQFLNLYATPTPTVEETGRAGIQQIFQ